MTRRKRVNYNAKHRALIWERYKQGDSLHDIAKMFDRFHSSIRRIIEESGGIKPAERKRAAKSLTAEEREEISRGLIEPHLPFQGKSIVMVAGRATELRKLIRLHGLEQRDQNHVNFY